jgi:teichoic acid transport system ATP-binding protein
MAISILVEDLTVIYRMRQPLRMLHHARTESTPGVLAVAEVSFKASEGEVIGLLGGNGSGKSTLLKAVAGLVPVTSGEVRTGSHPLLLGVNAALVGEVSGRRNAYLGGLALGLSPVAAREAVEGILCFAGVQDAADRPLDTYSSGMAARLKFAIATSVLSDIVLVDEALSVGDAEFQERSRSRMREVAESAGTVILVSHSARQLEESCTRGLWLDKGVLRFDGPIEKALKEYKARQ